MKNTRLDLQQFIAAFCSCGAFGGRAFWSRTVSRNHTFPSAQRPAGFVHTLATLAVVLMVMGGCTNDDEQTAFEREAFQPASAYTRTDDRGSVISADQDDWRVAPLYAGLVDVEPAFPNPVQTTGRLMLHVMVGGLDVINGLAVSVYHPDETLETIWISQESPLSPGLLSIPVSPLELGRYATVESARGLHRIILFDGRQNVLSYGDVQVE